MRIHPTTGHFQGSARERLEAVFLNHTFRWLIPGGVLVLVIPAERAAECAQILASHFKRTRIFRLGDPESVRYRQVVIVGVGGARAASVTNFAIARSARVVSSSPRLGANTSIWPSCLNWAAIRTSCRQRVRPRSHSKACRWMNWKMRFRVRRRPGKRREFSRRSPPLLEDGRSHHCTPAKWASSHVPV